MVQFSNQNTMTNHNKTVGNTIRYELKVCKPDDNLEITKPNVTQDTIYLKELLQQKQDQKQINIGRLGNNDIVLPDPQKNISKKHCFLKFDDYDWWIVDERSTNGTFVICQEQDPIDVRLEPDCQLALSDKDTILIPYKFEQDRPYYWKFVFYDPEVTNFEDNFNLFQPTAKLGYSLSQEKLFNLTTNSKEEVKLSPKQRKFIHYMVFQNQENNNQPIVCSYEELIEAIWEDTFNHSKNDVTLLAWYIRQKIEADSGEPQFLHTVPGRGFLLDIQALN